MSPESARIRQILQAVVVYGDRGNVFEEAVGLLDALDAKLEAAESDRDFHQDRAIEYTVNEAREMIARKAAERRAEQLTHALQCAQGFFQGADLQNCDTYALITEALASVEGAGE